VSQNDICFVPRHQGRLTRQHDRSDCNSGVIGLGTGKLLVSCSGADFNAIASRDVWARVFDDIDRHVQSHCSPAACV